MANIRRTAMGDAIDMDILRLSNENSIAIGNAKTNARGDLLGSGGKVIKTRAQIMQEYHKLNTQIASHDDEIYENAGLATQTIAPTPTNVVQPAAEDIPVAESASIPNYTKPRGSFAEAVAGEKEINQELLQPAPARSAPKGITRI